MAYTMGYRADTQPVKKTTSAGVVRSENVGMQTRLGRPLANKREVRFQRTEFPVAIRRGRRLDESEKVFHQDGGGRFNGKRARQRLLVRDEAPFSQGHLCQGSRYNPVRPFGIVDGHGIA